MDFFQHQEEARKKTGLLLFLLVCAVLVISAILSVVIVTAHVQVSGDSVTKPEMIRYGLMSLGGVTFAVLGAMSFRLIELSNSGGQGLAEKMGGRLLSSNTENPQHRQLLNVVEEMAIASGMPVPPVYLLEHEKGINAFAAGLSVDDAVIGITQGALDSFNREETQGVIAHEFSHILNGDMRLNMRLMGLLYGITCLGHVGSFVLDTSRYRSYSRSSSSNSKDSGGALILIGIAFMLVGWAGTLFGSMIKAAISRQREFLADASAIQFTRNDQGIAGALKKIGGHSEQSLLASSDAQEASHMMFGQSQLKGFNNLFATHPPLENRIQRIEPQWDGNFTSPQKRTNRKSESRGQAKSSSQSNRGRVLNSEMLDSVVVGGSVALGGSVLANGLVAEDIGDIGQKVIAQFPDELLGFAREPFSARFIPLLLIYDRSDEQRDIIARHIPMGLWGKISPWLDYQVPSHLRLSLLELSIPALKSMSPPQIEKLLDVLKALADTDNEYSIDEWCVVNLVEKLLLPVQGHVKQNKTLTQIEESTRWVLNELVWVCHSSEAEANHAFTLACEHIQMSKPELKAKSANWDLTKVALQLLVQLKPLHKQAFLEACRLAIESDGVINVDEAELYRVIACFLEVPVSPLTVTESET
ncbi:M48 family metallopeptidase [Vibrio cortegadensis]|uniref:M48 family metallopeptidase n=1 Tax=Vibrio cortegadensis TaxID=1328770 RepID=UPI0021C3CDD5|nr:M48 family metallopeptidase [Vibrio cortegadensis]MDN3696029.1 M48 family metallopeptidase [Vibrio cortegadensis]